MSRAKLTEPLELTTAFFRSVVDASPDCIRILSPDGRLQYMNPRGRELFEIDDFALSQGRPWAERWPDYTAEIDRCIVEALAGGAASFRARRVHRCGAIKWWRHEMSPILDEHGKPLAILAVSRDISAETDSAVFLREVLQLLPAPILIKSAGDGRFVLVNRAAEEVLGLSADAVLDKTVFDFVPEDQALKFTEEDAEVIRSRAVKIEQEEKVTTATYGDRYFVTKKMATYDADGPSHIFTIFEDVTEQRQSSLALAQALTEAEQANQAKSAFLANMSHEIRTPLNGVIAVADLLSRSDLNGHQRELVDIIRASGSTLQTLLSDILDLAKIESGQIAVDRIPFDLEELIGSSIALFRMRADETGLSLSGSQGADLGRMVLGDPLRIRQILNNLLSNAIKFTQKGEVALNATRLDGGDMVRFTVADTGIGFDADFKARAFGRFQQADASITRKFGGTGLGLNICRELADLMGGTLDCEAEPGRGARFWFDLPLPRLEAETAAPVPLESAAALAEERLRILVADDHPTNRRVVSLLLADVADMVAVENGAEAVEIVQTQRFDLILMDMQMPVMDGLTAVRTIRALPGPVANMPIIVLSANALREHVVMSLEAGANGHLGKPVTADGLMNAIAQLFDTTEAPAALSA